MHEGIFVTRTIPEAGLAILRDSGYQVQVNPLDRPLQPPELAAYAARCQGLLAMLSDQLDAAMLQNCPELRAISNYAVGTNNIDIAQCTRRGIGVSNTPDVLTDATAELAWALIFAVARRIVESDNFTRMGRWDGWAPLQFTGLGVAGKTLGVVGAGRIGQRVALMSQGFNMPVLYTARRDNPQLAQRLGARRVSLDQLLAQADIVSLHVPLLPDTRHMIGTSQLALMKPTALLINTARGPLVDEQALARALQIGTLAGAGLDVYEHEPKITPELLAMKNVVLLPHIGSATAETRAAMATMAATDLLAMLRGQRPAHPVNPEVWAGRGS